MLRVKRLKKINFSFNKILTNFGIINSIGENKKNATKKRRYRIS